MTSVALPPLAIAAIGATTLELPGLQPGMVLNARVLARIDDATLRILLGGDTLDFKTDRPLLPGTPVELVVDGTPSQPQLTLRVLAERVAPAGLQNELQDVEQAVATRPPAAGAPAVESAVKTVAAFVGQSAVRQGGLAPLYANLASTLARLDFSVPQPVADAARQLLSLRLEPGGDGHVDAGDVKAALQRSGLVTDAGRPAGAPLTPGRPIPAQADLRGALQSLRETLKTWADIERAPKHPAASSSPQPASSPAHNGLPAPSRLFGPLPPMRALPPVQQQAETAAQPAPGRPAPPPPNIGADGEADAALIKAALLRSGLVPGRDVFDGARPRLGQADLRAALQDLSETLQRWADTELSARPYTPPPARSGPLFTPPAGAVPQPPFRNAPTVPQAPVPATVQVDASPAEIAHQLLDETDAAIARHTLLQIASLPDEQGRGPRPLGDGSTHLTFDIPLAAGQSTAIAQLRIERDDAGQRADGAEPVWRVNFSIDLEPIGPVHARISLTGDRAAVILRAERSESAERLAQELPLLEAGLRGADLEPGTLLCRMGTPDTPPAAAGQFLDHAT